MIKNNIDSKEFGGFVKTPFLNEGEEDHRYALRYEEFIALLNKAYSGYKELYTEDGKQNWMSLTATTDSDGTNPYLKTLFNAINKKDNDQDITLNNHGDLIQWILKNLNPPPPISGTDLTWVRINTPTTSGQLTAYNESNRMYYSVNTKYDIG
mgnify:CR=1 FL=1